MDVNSIQFQKEMMKEKERRLAKLTEAEIHQLSFEQITQMNIDIERDLRHKIFQSQMAEWKAKYFPQQTEEEKQKERAKHEELVAKSDLRIQELRGYSLDSLRGYFAKYMDDYSEEKMAEIFDNNDTRRLKLRTTTIEEVIYSFEKLDEKEFCMRRKGEINLFTPLTKSAADTGLQSLNFSPHSLRLSCDWGRGKLENIKKDIFNQYIVNDGKDGLSYYFYGNIGAGKTTLLTAIARMLYTMLNVKPRYITMSSLMNLFSDSRNFDNRYAKDELDKIEDCYFLFIDNLGFPNYTEKQGEYALDFMFDRYRYRKPVFLATNKDVRCEELQQIAFNQQLKSWLQDSNYFYQPRCFTWEDRRS